MILQLKELQPKNGNYANAFIGMHVLVNYDIPIMLRLSKSAARKVPEEEDIRGYVRLYMKERKELKGKKGSITPK